jgi:hypothetical protein
MTPDEWSTWERLNGSKNTEEQWLACPEVGSLLCRALELRASDRKMRLFGCACCRMFWHYLVQPVSKAAVEATEQFAIGEISAEDMYAAAEAAAAAIPENPPRNTDRGRTEEYLEYLAAVSASEVARAEDEGGWPYWERLVDIPSNALSVAREQRFGLDQQAMQAKLCDRLRDIVGNPFRPVSVAPEWRTATVLALGRGILAERAFERLPILADALEEAGCSDTELLAHCREPRVHVLGCWVVDSLLGHSWREAEPSATADSPRDRR